MIRVLQCVNNMHRAGLETMLMNYYRHIDRNKIQFDFLTHRPTRSEYDDEIEDLGGKVYYAPRLYPQNYPAYFRYMKRFFIEHPEYRIIHSHIDAMSYLPLMAAKKAGVPIRIAHSHNTSIDKDFKYLMKEAFRWQLPHVATDYLACGTEAGKFLFGNRDFQVIPNAIDTSGFRFSIETRDAVRRSLGIENAFVIGCVGRLTAQKNISFLINVFREICKVDPNSVLLVIGGGNEENELQALTKKLGISERVMFLGIRSDVNDLYQAMDVFVMPSLFEGLPVVGIEAQFSDLHCVFSSSITREVSISEKAHFVSLERSYSDWASYILRLKRVVGDRNPNFQCQRYDIEQAKDVLEQYYLNKHESLQPQ